MLPRVRQVRRSLLADITEEWSADDIADLNRLLHRLQHDMQRITN